MSNSKRKRINEELEELSKEKLIKIKCEKVKNKDLKQQLVNFGFDCCPVCKGWDRDVECYTCMKCDTELCKKCFKKCKGCERELCKKCYLIHKEKNKHELFEIYLYNVDNSQEYCSLNVTLNCKVKDIKMSLIDEYVLKYKKEIETVTIYLKEEEEEKQKQQLEQQSLRQPLQSLRQQQQLEQQETIIKEGKEIIKEGEKLKKAKKLSSYNIVKNTQLVFKIKKKKKN